MAHGPRYARIVGSRSQELRKEALVKAGVDSVCVCVCVGLCVVCVTVCVCVSLLHQLRTVTKWFHSTTTFMFPIMYVCVCLQPVCVYTKLVCLCLGIKFLSSSLHQVHNKHSCPLNQCSAVAQSVSPKLTFSIL